MQELLITFFVVFFVVLVLISATLWVVFTKAGEPGWAALVPIYNSMVLARIVGKPEWWGLLPLIPFIGPIFSIILLLELAKVFGKSSIFGLGLVFLGPIFFLILAFGDAEYMRGGSKRSKRKISRFDDEDEEEEEKPRPRTRTARRDEEDEDKPRKRRDPEEDEEEERPRRR